MKQITKIDAEDIMLNLKTTGVVAVCALLLYIPPVLSAEKNLPESEALKAASRVKGNLPESEALKAASRVKGNLPESEAKKANSRRSSDFQEIENQADEFAKIAAKYYKEEKYQEAIDYYLKARKHLLQISDRNTAIEDKITRCREAISKCYFFWAEKNYFKALALADEKKFDEAIKNCEDAIEMWPQAKDKLNKAIARFKEMKQSYEQEKAFTRDSSIADQQNRFYSTDMLMRQGDAFYADKQYDQARDKYETILANDPYNTKAIEALRRINIAMLKAGTMRHEVSRSEYLTEATWKLVSPIKPRVIKNSNTPDGNSPLLKQAKEDPLMQKLKTIIIPQLSIEDRTLTEVLDILRRRSKELDKNREGVNIIYLRPSAINEGDDDEGEGGGEQNPVPGDPKAAKPAKQAKKADDAADSEDDNRIGVLSIEKQSLFKIIEDICKMKNLKFKIEKYAVVIADPKASFEELETRIYPVEAETVKNKLSSTSGGGKSAAKGNAGGGGGGEGGTESSATLVGDTVVRDYFIEAGIPFGPGADVVYDTYCRRLIATNTRSNLEKLENVLKNLNVTDPQVMVQTKFVEVSLNDLEELGFQYSFSRTNGNVAYAKTSETLAYTGQTLNADTKYSFYSVTPGSASATNGYGAYYGSTPPTIDANSTTTYRYMEAPLQNKSVSFSPNSSSLVRDITYLPEMSGTTDGLYQFQVSNSQGYKLSATVNAIDQADSSDILACPKITTLNGYDATIAMVTEQYFPDDWSEADIGTIAGTGGQGSVPLFTPSIPDFGDAVRLGIELKVKPVVDMATDNPDTIDIKVAPLINQHIGWTDYSYELNVSTGANQVSKYTNIVKKAIFEVRSIDTQVKCSDGEPVVLGGVVRDTVNAIDDQYPILGNIPVIGRLFQSKSKTSSKTNLLIFLTCRLVGPDGLPIRERTMRGLPSIQQ